MRMWGVDTILMCRKHLLGEHVELHMFVGAINKGKNLAGYISGGLVEIHNIRSRHRNIAKELIRRKYNHKSPLPKFESWTAGEIDKKRSLLDLMQRCRQCYGKAWQRGYMINDKDRYR